MSWSSREAVSGPLPGLSLQMEIGKKQNKLALGTQVREREKARLVLRQVLGLSWFPELISACLELKSQAFVLIMKFPVWVDNYTNKIPMTRFLE